MINTKQFLSMLRPSNEMTAECRMLREKLMKCVYRKGSAYNAAQLRKMFRPYDRLRNMCIASERFTNTMEQIVGGSDPLYPDEKNRLLEMFAQGWKQVNYDRFVRWVRKSLQFENINQSCSLEC